MNKLFKAVALSAASMAAVTTLAIGTPSASATTPVERAQTSSAPAQSSASDKKKTGGGALVFKNSANSTRMIRVWMDNNCPTTVEGFKRSDIVYEGEFARFGSVDSVYVGPWRKVHFRYWDATVVTKEKGRCINIGLKPSEVVTIKYFRQASDG